MPSTNSIMITYGFSTTLVFLYCTLSSLINSAQELHMFLPQELCLQSEIPVELTKLFFYFILPIVIILAINLFFDSNYWLKPYSYDANVYGPILNLSSIKTSALTCIFILGFIIVCSLPFLQLSNKVQGLVATSLFLPVFIAKGPAMLSWTYQVDDKNLQEAKHNLMVLKEKMQNKQPTVEETSV